jgi:polyhydroxyalkanoic acid synthase PhaR subunit
VPQKSNRQSNFDPTAAWREWYDNAASVWSNMVDGNKEAYVDPFGLYRQWLKSAEERKDDGPSAATPTADPGALWKDWFEAASDMWRRAVGSAPADPLGLTKQWMEMLDETRARVLSAESPSLDPLSFFREWYDKMSQMWSSVVGDMIGSEAFVESASRFFDTYVSYYKAMRQASETQLHNMQMPTRADVARVAGLVVTLEDKVDQLADAVDTAADERGAHATAADVRALDARIARIESRPDALLKAVERLDSGRGMAAEQRANGTRATRRAPATRTRRTTAETGGRAAG